MLSSSRNRACPEHGKVRPGSESGVILRGDAAVVFMSHAQAVADEDGILGSVRPNICFRNSAVLQALRWNVAA